MIKNVRNFIIVICGFVGFLYSQMKWEHQTGDVVSQIRFYNNIGFMYLRSGVIKKSIDYGKNWKNIFVLTDLFATSTSGGCMDTPDSMHVFLFIPTTPSRLFRTKDGGENWDTILTPIYGVSDVCFIDSLNGWVVESHKRVWRTNDGGNTWQLLSSGGDTSFTHVEFVNQNTGFVRGTRGFNFDRLFKTVDGGYTWNVLLFPSTNIYFFDFIDELNGYVIASVWETYERRRIYKTTDGGQTWSVFYEFPPGFIPRCISAKNISEIWIGGNSGNKACIYHYKNGTWNVWVDQFSSSEPIFSIEEISSNIAVAGGYYGLILRTEDGLNFDEVTAGPGEWATYIKAIDTLNIWAIGRCWGVTYSYIINSRNGGRKWHRKQPLNNTGIFTDVEFTDSLNGWVTDTLNKRILYTQDGGNTWSYAQISLPISKITFINSQKGWGCGGIFYPYGANGWVYRTVDGGQSWQLIFQTGFSAITDIIFIDSLRGWIVGGQYEGSGPHHAFIAHTINGGYTWTLQYYELYKDPFECVEFVDGNYGWVGASVLPPSLRTIDGGNTWIQMDSIMSSITFLNSNYGWGIKRLENSFSPAYTLDGGYTWINLNTGIPVSEIYYKSIDVVEIKNGCWLSSSRGSIYRFHGEFVNIEDHFNLKIPFNPVSFKFIEGNTIKIFIPQDDEIELSLLDISGRNVVDISSRYLNKGWHTFNIKDLRNNIYFLKIKGLKQKYLTKIIFIKK